MSNPVTIVRDKAESISGASTTENTVRVAVVQAEPCYFDLQEAVQKSIRLIDEAGQKGCKLIAFPEVWIPGYPSWIWSRGTDIELCQAYIKNSISVDSPEFKTICAAAARNKTSVFLGFSERDNNTLYLAQAFIDPEGNVKMHRRKIKPTHMERTVFGDGGGSSLINVVDQPGLGKVGGLCCWEHSQPLLKFHTHSQGEQIHIAAWPAQLAHEEGKGLWSTANEGSLNLSVTYAIEGGCFVLHACAILTQKGVDVMGTHSGDQYYAAGGGTSCVIRPDGKIMTEFIPANQEGLVIADIDLDDILRSKVYLDTQGHYSRPDLLWLGVDTKEKHRVRTT